MNTNKDNIAAALILSLLVCICGAVVWGLIYVLGYFAAIVALVEVILAIGIYSKFKTVNWKAILWISILTILFNELAMYIAEIIVLKMELNCTFSQATTLLNNAFSNQEVYSIFVRNTITNIFFTVIGIACYVVSYIRNRKQAQKQPKAPKNTPQPKQEDISFNYTPNLLEQQQVILQKEPETLEERVEEAKKEKEEKEYTITPPAEEVKPTKSDNPLEEITSIETITNILLEDFTSIINRFKSSNNKEILKTDLKTFKDTKIATLSDEKKAAIKSLIQFKIDYTNMSLEGKKNLSILIGLIK